MPFGTPQSNEQVELELAPSNSDVSENLVTATSRSTKVGKLDKLMTLRSPMVTITALFAGLGFALVHHLLAEYLNHKVVADLPVSQAWISRFSTALAFLVKTTLVLSAGTVYVQYQWLRLHQKSFETREIDALTSVLHDIFSFVCSRVWIRQPLLASIAATVW